MIVQGGHAPYLEPRARGLGLFCAGVQGAGTATVFRDLSFHAPFSAMGVRIAGANSAAIRAGRKANFAVPFDCYVEQARVEADAAGSITFDIYKVASVAAFPPVPARDTITPLALGRPKLRSARQAYDNALYGWTRALTKGEILAIDVLDASGINYVTLTLLVSRNSQP